ncbi:MAG TPA: preprotein translocase subunit SecE [Gaiellaceae bacterium]
MARPSRQQRRERRAQQPALAGAGTPPTVPTPRAARDAGEPERRPRRETETGRRGGPFQFFREAYAELKKVEWPDQKAVISGTTVVVIACIIVGAYLWLNDEVWKYVVKHVLLR